MRTANVVKSIPSNFSGLVNELYVIISVVQQKYNLLLVPSLPFALQGFDYPLNTKTSLILKLLRLKCLILQCNGFQN